jgi:septal ring factor EnvC (AmiA/AmiB activator)
MATIEQLENEIDQKIKALNESLNVQYLLRVALENNIKTLLVVEKRLKGIEEYLTDSHNTINRLQQENSMLKSSCDNWIKRAINLEFKVLSVCDMVKNKK